MILGLDHLNIRTANLDAMVRWYVDMLGLANGPRPDFPFNGAWLYASETAVVHLIEVEADPKADMTDLKLEHGAFRATGYAEFVRRFEAAGATVRVSRVPGLPIVQVNVWDPDGNHLHVDFDASETAAG